VNASNCGKDEETKEKKRFEDSRRMKEIWQRRKKLTLA